MSFASSMPPSNLPDHVSNAIHAAPITNAYIVSRRGPMDTKFTKVELREMGDLTETVLQIKSDQRPDNIEQTAAILEGR